MRRGAASGDDISPHDPARNRDRLAPVESRGRGAHPAM